MMLPVAWLAVDAAMVPVVPVVGSVTVMPAAQGFTPFTLMGA